jgi:phosphoglycerate dehydrogenase-like enzyme
MFMVLRWGQAEYERGLAPRLPDGVVLRTAPLGDDAPLEDADVLVVPSLQRVEARHVPRLVPPHGRCRLVLTTTSGFDHVDVNALRAAGIACARMPLVRRDAVVQTTLGMILSLTRRFGLLDLAAAEGRWARAELPAIGAVNLGTVGVVGAAGVIGSRMCVALDALGARVLRCDPALSDGVPLAELLAASDVVTLHCALDDHNARLIDGPALSRMRPGAVLVNTARGRLVDLEVALRALHDRRLGGLGLDVFPREPADLAALRDPRVIVTPHAAGWHPGLGEAVSEGMGVAVEALLAGGPVPWQVRTDTVTVSV